MNTYHIIKRQTGYGVAQSLNSQGMSTSTVVDTVFGTLSDAGHVLLERLRANELEVDGDTYYSQLNNGKRFAAFTVGECHCECYEYDCEYIIASC
jgi:aspartyl aminopeptidase